VECIDADPGTPAFRLLPIACCLLPIPLSYYSSLTSHLFPYSSDQLATTHSNA